MEKTVISPQKVDEERKSRSTSPYTENPTSDKKGSKRKRHGSSSSLSDKGKFTTSQSRSKRKKRSSSSSLSEVSSISSSSDSEEYGRKNSKHKKKQHKKHLKKSKKHHSAIKLSKYMKDRSSVTGKVIKMKVKKTSKDKEREENRKQLLEFLNASVQ